MEAPLFADACFPAQTVFRLRRLGHEVETVQQVEGTSRPEQPMSDLQVLKHAIRVKRAVITLNAADFEKLHREHPDHKGIIVCKENLNFTQQARLIHAAIKRHWPLRGKLIYVSYKADGE